MKYILILSLILANISCKKEMKISTVNLKSKTELKTDSSNSFQKHTVKKKPFVIAVDVESFFLNDFNISKLFNEKAMIVALGEPDKFEKSTDYIDETGFPDYDIDYGKNTIWASYGYISNVYLKDSIMNINGIKLGDKRDKTEIVYNVNTKKEKYIQLVNSLDESIFIKFNDNNDVIELSYGKLIL